MYFIYILHGFFPNIKENRKKYIYMVIHFITNFLRKYLHNIIAQLGNQAMVIIGQKNFKYS